MYYTSVIGGIRLFKEDGELIQEWKANRSDITWQDIQIVPEGETIIGIYGNKSGSAIRSIGFITRKLQT